MDAATFCASCWPSATSSPSDTSENSRLPVAGFVAQAASAATASVAEHRARRIDPPSRWTPIVAAVMGDNRHYYGGLSAEWHVSLWDYARRSVRHACPRRAPSELFGHRSAASFTGAAFRSWMAQPAPA